MQETSQLYKNILASEHWTETKVSIDGVDYCQDKLVSLSTSLKVFGYDNNGISVGNCISSQIDLVLYEESINVVKRAELKPYVRLVNNANQSEWLQKGLYYISTRSIDDIGTLTIKGFDPMLKTDQKLYSTDGDQGSWPKTDIEVVNIIANRIGVSIDSRTTALINKSYTVQYPGFGENGLTMREVLGLIGCMYAGNWIISDIGQLRLIQFSAYPIPDYILGNEESKGIIFGNNLIKVD